MKTPVKDEFEPWQSGVRHVPTDLKFQVIGMPGFLAIMYAGNKLGDYDEKAIVALARTLLPTN